MRIGIDARMLHKAGIRRYVTELIQNLSNIDTRNHYIIYFSIDARLGKTGNLRPNFQPVYLNAPLFSLREHLELIAHLRHDKPDVFHTTFDFGAPLWPVRNLIVTVHDVFFGSETFFRNYKTRILYQLLTKYSIGKSKGIIVVSNFIKHKLLEYIPQARRKLDIIKVISNGVGPEFFHSPNAAEAEQIRQKYTISGKYVLCVGSFASEVKNLPRILQAFSKMPLELLNECQLVVAGEIFDRVPDAADLISRLMANKRILCLGLVPERDLQLLYRNAEVFVYPSLHEGFGIPILEAMACGTPVITSNVTAMPEIAGNAAVLVDPYNVNEIREKIINVLTDRELRNELSGKGIERAKKFSWLITAEQTLGVYKETGRN